MTLVAIGCQIVSVVIVQSVVAHELGPAGIGVLSLLLTVPTMVVAASNMGLVVSNTYLAAHDPVVRPRLATMSLLMSIVMGNLCGVAILVIRLVTPEWLSALPADSLGILAIGLPALYLLSYLASLLLGMSLILRYNIVSTVRLLGTLLTVVFLHSLKRLTTHALPSAWLGGIGLAAVLALIWTLAAVGSLQSPDWMLFLKSFRYGIKADLANLLTQFNYRAGLFFITLATGITDAGVYMAAVSVNETLGYLAAAVATVLTPRIAASRSSHALTPVVCRMVIGVTVVCVLLAGLAASKIVELVYGPGFESAVALSRWMLPGTVALAGARVLSADLMGRGKSGYSLLTSMAGACITLLTFPALIQALGLFGPALGSSLVYGMLFLLSVGWYVRETGLAPSRIPALVVPQPDDWRIVQHILDTVLGSHWLRR